MHTFNELTDKLNIIINTTKNKSQLIRLNNLKTQISTREYYYNTIPKHIKTTSTLKYIIDNLEFNLSQIIGKQQQEINTNYSEDTYTIPDDELILQLQNQILQLQNQLNDSANRITLLQDTINFLNQNLGNFNDERNEFNNINF